MKVLLVNPTRIDPTEQKYTLFANGLLYIAAVLEKNGQRKRCTLAYDSQLEVFAQDCRDAE